MPSRIYLDLSRLIYAAWSRTPAGIPRVELAYASYLLANFPDRIEFVVVDIVGRFHILDKGRAVDFINAIARYWAMNIVSRRAYFGIVARAMRIHAELLVSRWGSLLDAAKRENRRGTYIIPSQFHLERSSAIERLKQNGRLHLVYFVHDILPTLFPEYFEPDSEERCRLRMVTAARLADLIVTNSKDTAKAFRRAFAAGREPNSIVVAPLGTDIAIHREKTQSPVPTPYFLIVGTIEPRKNHLLILNVWRAIWAKKGVATPHLVVIGSRGWENENVVDMLERTRGLRPFVHERNRVSDNEIAQLFAGARALLMPSFAEGFGLPVVEALVHGLPVLCSDIPVFREVGRQVPEFIDPLDGLGWQAAIEAYCPDDSPERNAQLARLASWSAPTWDDHFKVVIGHLERIADDAETAAGPTHTSK